jgi:predicted small secreted protein
MKRRFAAFAAVMAALFLASCATMLGPRDVEIPLAKLQESIAGRFPFNNRFLELLDIRVTNPRVALQPDSNRILTSMDASIAPPFMNRSWSGNLAVSGQLRFDPARNALVLGEPRVETFNVNGLDPLYANQITRVGSLLAEELLKDIPLYTFRPDELRYGGTTYNPTRITTRSNSLVVTFEPAR